MADSIDIIDLNIFGGPTEIDVSVDLGQTGNRGSFIWVGSGDPSLSLTGQPYQVKDLYINTNTSDAYYSWLYQYTEEVGSLNWVPVLLLNPSQWSAIVPTTFTTGSTTINVPVKNLTAKNGVALSNFIIRYNIKNANPVSSGFTYSLTGTYPNQNISIVINAVSYNGSVWSQLTSAQDVHLFISYKAT